MQNFRQLLERLVDSGLEFVIVGGYAAVTHGSSFVTRDLDICMDLSNETVAKLRAVLAQWNPKHRMTPQQLSSQTRQDPGNHFVENVPTTSPEDSAGTGTSQSLAVILCRLPGAKACTSNNSTRTRDPSSRHSSHRSVPIPPARRIPTGTERATSTSSSDRRAASRRRTSLH